MAASHMDSDRGNKGSEPIKKPRQWRAYVNKPQSKAEVEAIRHRLQKGTPFGGKRRVTQVAVCLKLQHTLRPRRRARKSAK